MARPPTRDFGKRRPAVIQAGPPVKRSRHVALLLMGTVVVGGGAYALTSSRNCEPKSPGMAAPAAPQAGTTDCSSRGSSSGGSHGGYWSRHSFYGGDSSSSSSSSSPASGSGSASVTRGGFGSFAHSFASHFSGGG
jgi:hypothetical protein